MKHLTKYIRPYWWYILLTMFIKLGGALLELLIPSLMETMLRRDVMSAGGNTVYVYGGLMILCAIGSMSRRVSGRTFPLPLSSFR